MRELTEFEKLMLEQPCATCGRGPGEWCLTKTDRRAHYMHAARWYTAKGLVP